MSSTPYIIPTRFTAIDGISPVVRNMSSSVGDLATKLSTHVARQERLFRRLTPGLGSATKQVLAYGSAGAALAGIGATGKGIMDNQTAFQSLSAVTGVVGDDFIRMRKEADSLAIELKRNATEIAGSFEEVGSMMSQYLDDPKAMRMITKEGNTLAKASRQDLVPSLQNLTSIMNQFNLGANMAADTVNRLTAGEIVGSLRTSQVTEAIQEFGAGAYSANIDLAESVALTEALAKQMKIDKIGVGARNILTVMDSATGLSRKSRKELRAAGVDMGFLMDKTQSLSKRLHELSKVAGNEKAITKIFGRENKTAAQVIFNQLDVFDQYLAKIRLTNQADRQAATNSATLSNSVQQLKNTWINYFTVQDRANTGLEMATTGIKFLTNHMDGFITVGLSAVGLMATWKVAILAQKAAVMGLAAVSNSFFLVDMVKYVATTQGMTKSMAALQIAQTTMLGSMMLTPWGMLATGAIGLGVGLHLLLERHKELNEQYRKEIDLRRDQIYDEERAKVDALTQSYMKLGLKKKEAFIASHKSEIASLDVKIAANEAKVKEDKARVAETSLNPFRLAEHLKNKEKLDRDRAEGVILSTQRTGEMSEVEAARKNGYLSNKEAGGINSYKSRFTNAQNAGSLTPEGILEQRRINMLGAEEAKYKNTVGSERPEQQYSERQIALLEKIAAQNEKPITVNITGLPAGAAASTNGQASTPNSY